MSSSFIVSVSSPQNYKYERTRLNSFAGFPRNTLDVRELAAVGFFYTKYEDVVRCVFCGVEVGAWEDGDNPTEEHRKWSRSCKFLLQEEVGNIPLDSSDVSSPVQRFDSNQPGRQKVTKAVHCPTEKFEKLKIAERMDPSHPTFASLESRLRSFNTWPVSSKLKPVDLAEAGFFYTGLGDKTVCFQCGGGLKLWAETDSPWEEHALFFSKCAFVLSIKGQDYISKVLGTKPSTLSPEELRNVSAACASKSGNPSSNFNKTSECNEGVDTEMCKVCFSAGLEVVFLPCGHLVTCTKCASSLSSCVVCRQNVAASVRVYIS